MKYTLAGQTRIAKVDGFERITDDPDFPRVYWLWKLILDKPIRMYDGSLIYTTYIRRFTPPPASR